ncbi:hypothetical protein FQN60_007663 [Etheostoma spectabile]|uniref:Uncharacterized protein n=1 Tax=Etheostoma spectabile TaxID=54343 RepID=A0A5J5CY60_9PERO|nr:hypothetical protein FQN60_007663 [Etheostoma spectabile]
MSQHRRDVFSNHFGDKTVRGLSVAFALKLVPPEGLLLHRSPSVRVSGWSSRLRGRSTAAALPIPHRGMQSRPRTAHSLCGGYWVCLRPGVAGWSLSHEDALLFDIIDGHSLLVAVLSGQAEVVAQCGGGGHKAQTPILQVQLQALDRLRLLKHLDLLYEVGPTLQQHCFVSALCWWEGVDVLDHIVGQLIVSLAQQLSFGKRGPASLEDLSDTRNDTFVDEVILSADFTEEKVDFLIIGAESGADEGWIYCKQMANGRSPTLLLSMMTSLWLTSNANTASRAPTYSMSPSSLSSNVVVLLTSWQLKRDKGKQSLYSPIGKESLGVSLVRHGLRKPSKETMRDSRLGLSITAGMRTSDPNYIEDLSVKRTSFGSNLRNRGFLRGLTPNTLILEMLESY